jgi:hypothetical protein
VTDPVGLLQETKGLNSRFEIQPLFRSRWRSYFMIPAIFLTKSTTRVE